MIKFTNVDTDDVTHVLKQFSDSDWAFYHKGWKVNESDETCQIFREPEKGEQDEEFIPPVRQQAVTKLRSMRVSDALIYVEPYNTVK